MRGSDSAPVEQMVFVTSTHIVYLFSPFGLMILGFEKKVVQLRNSKQ